MTTNDTFDRRLAAWLDEDAANRISDHLDEVLVASAASRQRSRWSSLERWLPVDTTFRPRPFHVFPSARLLVLAALILAMLLATLLTVGSRPRLPEPFGLARNGIFVTSRDGELYTVDPTTSLSTPLVLGDGFDFSPIFSRDGTKIVFLRSDGPLTEPAILTLMVAEADGSDIRAVTPPTESLDWFDWSPNGTQIAYMAKDQLWVADVATGTPRMLPGTKPAHFPTWLPPDGREILYREGGAHPGVYAVSPDGINAPRRVSNPAKNEFDFGSLAVAPDGATASYTRWSDTSDPWVPRVYSLDLATGDETAFLTTPGTGQRGPIAYSPDARLVAYARIYRTGTFDLVVANADGSGQERTIGPRMPAPVDGWIVDATWAFTPDGTALLVRYGNDDAGAVQLLPLDGSAPSTLLDTGGFEFVDVQRLAP